MHNITHAVKYPTGSNDGHTSTLNDHLSLS